MYYDSSSESVDNQSEDSDYFVTKEESKRAKKLAKKPSKLKNNQIKITTINANDFILQLHTRQPKKFRYRVYGDKIQKIKKISNNIDFPYTVAWQDGAEDDVSRQYLEEYHPEKLKQFQIQASFRFYIKRYGELKAILAQKLKNKAKKQQKSRAKFANKIRTKIQYQPMRKVVVLDD